MAGTPSGPAVEFDLSSFMVPVMLSVSSMSVKWSWWLASSVKKVNGSWITDWVKEVLETLMYWCIRTSHACLGLCNCALYSLQWPNLCFSFGVFFCNNYRSILGFSECYLLHALLLLPFGHCAILEILVQFTQFYCLLSSSVSHAWIQSAVCEGMLSFFIKIRLSLGNVAVLNRGILPLCWDVALTCLQHCVNEGLDTVFG